MKLVLGILSRNTLPLVLVGSGHSRWLFSGSLRPLHDQCLLHGYPTHKTDFAMDLPQAPGSDHSYQRGGEGRAPLLVPLVTNEPT